MLDDGVVVVGCAVQVHLLRCEVVVAAVDYLGCKSRMRMMDSEDSEEKVLL